MFFLIILSCGDKESIPNETLPNEPSAINLKVMTYNIYGARPGGIKNIQELADVINRIKPDLVALQEVDVYTTRNGKDVHVAEELAKLCNMDYFFAKAIDRYDGEYGDAVLSKLPIKATKAYNLSTTTELGGEIRSVARITVNVGGEEVYFISTHFDHLSNEANRVRQAREFVDIIKDFDKPVIVGADFNAKPNSKTIKILREQLVLGCANNNCNQFTFSTTNPNRVIDYIMYKDINKLKVSLYTVDTWANIESDHFPVYANFKVAQNNK